MENRVNFTEVHPVGSNCARCSCEEVLKGSVVPLLLCLFCLSLQVTGQLRSRLNDVQTAIAFQSDGFLSNESQDALRQFTNANVSAINITGMHLFLYLLSFLPPFLSLLFDSHPIPLFSLSFLLSIPSRYLVSLLLPFPYTSCCTLLFTPSFCLLPHPFLPS